MPSHVACPGCKGSIALPDHWDGARLTCGDCGNEVALQAAPPANADAPANPPPTTLDTAYVPAGSAGSRPRATFCAGCGAKFARSEAACPYCGLASQETPGPRPDDWPSLKRPLEPIRTALPLIGALLIPLGLLFLFGGPILAEEFIRGPRRARFFITVIGVVTGTLLEIAALICFLRWLWQAWRLVLRGDEEYTPGLLIGMLFVPFFNLYWMFRVIPGLSEAVHRELKTLAPRHSHLTGWGPGIATCILALFPPLWPITICMFLAWVFLVNHALNRLVRFHELARLQAERMHDDIGAE